MSFRSGVYSNNARQGRPLIGNGVLAGIVAGVAFLTSSGAAFAQGWTVEASTFQRAEAETNRSLGAEPDGSIYGGSAGVILDATTATERGAFSLSSTLGGDYFTGPGAVDESVELDSRLAADFERRFGRSTLGLGGNVSAQPTAFAQFDDSGQTNDGSSQVNFGLNGDLSHRLSERNRINFAADARTQRFFDGDTTLDPTNRYSGETSWGYSLSPVTETSLGVGLTALEVDNDENVESFSYDAFAGVSSQFSEVVSFDLRGGASFSETSRDGQDDTDDVNFNGSLGLIYQMPTVTTRVTASQSVEPSSSGELRNASRFGVNVNYLLSPRSQVSLDTGYTYQTSADGFEDIDTSRRSLRVSPAYQLGLSERWDMSLGYNFKYSDESEQDLETSHGVFLELRQNFFILP